MYSTAHNSSTGLNKETTPGGVRQPGAVRSRKFCCCIPVRFGVIVLTLLGFLGGGFIGVVGSLNVKQLGGAQASVIAQIVVYFLLCVVSFLGLLGGIIRNLTLIRIYFFMGLLHLALSLAGGIYGLHSIFNNPETYMATCMEDAGNNNSTDRSTCEASYGVVKALLAVFFVLFWLIEIGCLAIVNSYSSQLKDEREAKGSSV